MEGLILLRGARQLLTMRGAQGPRRGPNSNDPFVIPDGSVLMRNGRILSVGPSRRVENLAEARKADVIEVNGAVLMPGLIDAHTFLPSTPAAARRFLHLAFRHGVTTVETKASGGALRSLPELTGEPISIVPTLYAAPDQPPIEEPLLTRVARKQLARFVDLPPVPANASLLRSIRAFGLGLRFQAEAGSAVDWIAAAATFSALAVDVGTPLDPAARQLLAELPTVATLQPEQVHLARELIAHGVPVALVSGFRHAAGATCSMLTVMAQACLQGALTVEEALVGSTINAAHSLGMGDRIGSIETGKQADMLILHVSDYREIPYHLGVNLVSKIVKSGKILE